MIQKLHVFNMNVRNFLSIFKVLFESNDDPICPSDISQNLVHILFYTLLALYFVITALGIILGIVSAVRSTRRRFGLYKISLVLLPIATLARGIDMATSNPISYLTYQIGCYLSLKTIILGGICGHVFLATQMTFLLFWILTFFKIYARSTRFMTRVKQIYGLVVGIIILLWSIVIVLVVVFDSDPYKKTLIRRVEVIYSSTICIIVAIAFVLFGSKMYKALRTKNSGNHRDKEHRKVAFMTVLSFILFSFRAMLTLIDMFAAVSVVGVFIIRLAFLFLFEIVPAVMLMVLLLSTKISKTKKNPREDVDEDNEPLVIQMEQE